jgi:predicted DNA-binding transcriptional regulator AlpA
MVELCLPAALSRERAFLRPTQWKGDMQSSALVIGRRAVEQAFGCQRRELDRLIAMGAYPAPLPDPRPVRRPARLWRRVEVEAAVAKLTVAL